MKLNYLGWPNSFFLGNRGPPECVNHDEEICAALRFRWFSYDDVMQDMVHKANHQVINGNPFKSITKPSKLERGTT